MIKRNFSKKGFISSFSLQFITKESQGRNWKVGTEVKITEECCFLSFLSWLAHPALLYYPEPPAHRLTYRPI